jgi:hypothetical protein
MPLETLPYAPPPERQPDRTYLIMLVVLAVLYGMSTVTVAFVGQMPAMDAAGRWAMRFSAIVCGFVVALIVATLIVRAKTRSNGCLIWTKAFNIFLLLLFPFGTVVGIYGLWKVDKPERSTGA